MNFALNIDIVSVGFAVATSTILGFAIFFSNPKSKTNQYFLFFVITNVGWSIFNYLTYRVTNMAVRLTFIRFVLYFAIFQTFSYLLLMDTFPDEQKKISKITKYVLIPWTTFVAYLTLTPWVFSGIITNPDSLVSQPIVAKGVVFFGLTAISYVVWGCFKLAIKLKNAVPEEKRPYRLLLIGAVIMFSLIIFFNFIGSSLLKNSSFIPFSAFFTLPFIIFTSYAIIKHHLMNIKVFSTEILTLLLALAILLETVTAKNITELLFGFGIFILVLSIGVLLIKSVKKEIEQREQLETLSRELGGANEKLKALDQARAEFITIASHQLRTPPATIKWYLSAAMAGDYGKLPPEVASVIEKAAITNNHLISLIEDMLNVSRIERGKMEFLFEPSQVEELASFAFEQLIPMAKIKKLDYTYTPPKKPLPEILADKEKLRQVMNNLIDNALKYTKLGTVAVSLFLKDNEIVFQVKDSGKGISPDEQNSIFQKYSRGKESIKQSAGLGLGLYVAKIIVDEHKGKVWAESKGEGQGSVFSFSLPVNSGLKQTTMVDLGAK